MKGVLKMTTKTASRYRPDLQCDVIDLSYDFEERRGAAQSGGG